MVIGITCNGVTQWSDRTGGRVTGKLVTMVTFMLNDLLVDN